MAFLLDYLGRYSLEEIQVGVLNDLAKAGRNNQTPDKNDLC